MFLQGNGFLNILLIFSSNKRASFRPFSRACFISLLKMLFRTNYIHCVNKFHETSLFNKIVCRYASCKCSPSVFVFSFCFTRPKQFTFENEEYLAAMIILEKHRPQMQSMASSCRPEKVT